MIESNETIQRIKELCAEKNWSIYRLSKETDIPYTTLNNMLNRNTDPTLPSLKKLCAGFGISLSDFFKNDCPIKTQLTNSETQLLANWKLLSTSDQKLLQIYLHGLLKKEM